MPAYQWLESLDRDQIVSGDEVAEWFDRNAEFRDRLLSRHTKYHMMHYVQKLHLKLLKKRGKYPKTMLLSTARALLKTSNSLAIVRDNATTMQDNSFIRKDEVLLNCKSSVNTLKENPTFSSKKSEAFVRYQLLTDLQNQLIDVLSKQKSAANLVQSSSFPLLKQSSDQTFDSDKKEESSGIMVGDASHSLDTVSVHVTKQSKFLPTLDANSGPKRKQTPVIAAPAWSHCEAFSGRDHCDQPSTSHSGETRTLDILKEDTNALSSKRPLPRKNILMCVQGRERGSCWPLVCSPGGYAGRAQEKWIPFFEGWRSLGGQFEGPAAWLSRRSYSSWVPSWCAYTSSLAAAQPTSRQGVQKVLHVRFHPEGLPQLVCSSNEAPNELLLFNLRSGRAIQLSGHNCQIQAVDFAVRGASIVSCGSKFLKVWDCTTGSCLYTLGSVGDDRALVGHTEKINAMTVNSWQSCLVATSSGRGDGKLLLWNALRGELAADLNSNHRVGDQLHPSLQVMEFCNENLLACGSDCEHGSPAVVQLWDIDSPQSCSSFPANDSYITSLRADSACNTIITGSGDGIAGLFDIRTCSAINYLSVGSGHEVTSVSFSSCGTYFNAASTSNNTMVWDTRLMPTNRRQIHLGSSQNRDAHFLRPLHCLSHGKQMPTAEHAGQLPGHVDEGDQGVNDARWLHREPVLVSVSGDGSIAMWDVTLGMPCIRHLVSHARCVNTVAVAPSDEYLCSGGDDQKVVLYHNKRGMGHQKWRLSHPLPGME